MRVLTTSLIGRLGFPSIQRARRWVRRSFDAGLVNVSLHGGALHRENLVSLAPHGAAVLRDLRGEDFPIPRLAPLQPATIEHLLARNAVWIAIATGAEAAGLRLVSAWPDYEIAGRAPKRSGVLVPDAVFVLDGGGRRIVIALEIDRATERHAALHEKFRRYRIAAASPTGLFGLGAFRALFVATKDTRLRTIAKISRAEHGEQLAIFRLLADLADPARVFAPVCWTADGLLAASPDPGLRVGLAEGLCPGSQPRGLPMF